MKIEVDKEKTVLLQDVRPGETFYVASPTSDLLMKTEKVVKEEGFTSYTCVSLRTGKMYQGLGDGQVRKVNCKIVNDD